MKNAQRRPELSLSFWLTCRTSYAPAEWRDWLYAPDAENRLNTTQRDHLNTIERSANNLLAIINDVLDFSKLEAGKLILESIPFPLRSTLDDVVAVSTLVP